jgi:hypothetical protein
MAKDVIVVVQRDALPKTKESLDILLVSTTGTYPVNTYWDVPSVEAVYGEDGPCPNSKIVRKARTLLNQGKTTLANTLVGRFKIVGFDPPKATPATSATFEADFSASTGNIPIDANIQAVIGDDDNAIIAIAPEYVLEAIGPEPDITAGTKLHFDTSKTPVISTQGARFLQLAVDRGFGAWSNGDGVTKVGIFSIGSSFESVLDLYDGTAWCGVDANGDWISAEHLKGLGSNLFMNIVIGTNTNIGISLQDDISAYSVPMDALAAAFAGTTFTKGGKAYIGTADGARVTFTATVQGVTGSIPEQLKLYADEYPITGITPVVEFVNGRDALSAAEELIMTIQEFQSDVDNDWYYLITDRDEESFVTALAKFAEASEPSEAELGAGVEDHRKFYMGQTTNKAFASLTARAAVIYTDPEYLDEEPDASYSGNVAPFYPRSVTWKFKRPQDGNAPTGAGLKLISLPKLTDGEREALLSNHVNFLTEEYKRQYVKNGTCLDGEFIDVVLGGDWIAARMRSLLYDILLTNANIDYDDAGFGLVTLAVIQALAEAVDLGIISRDPDSKNGVFTVKTPKYADSTEEQRRGRIMPDITWEALLSGAIHQVKAKGALRASL